MNKFVSHTKVWIVLWFGKLWWCREFVSLTFEKKNLRVANATLWALSVVWVNWGFHKLVDCNTTWRYLKTFTISISCPLICLLCLIFLLEKTRILVFWKFIVNGSFLQCTVRAWRALLRPTSEWDKMAVSSASSKAGLGLFASLGRWNSDTFHSYSLLFQIHEREYIYTHINAIVIYLVLVF